MSLTDAINQIGTLGGKTAGQLIRPQDWNTLINALGELGATLTGHDQQLGALGQRVTAVESTLQTAVQQVEQLSARVNSLEQEVAPLLDSYRVTLSTTRQSFATGELCEITAKVTDLRGRLLAAPLPWVDFVSTWGRLRAKAGFVSRAGVGDNSLSVQVNAQGVAQVVLRADHAEGFSESEEAQVGAAMNIRLPGQTKTVAQALLGAAAPSDPDATAAYKVLHTEYERRDSLAVRSFADVYYLRTPEWGAQAIVPNYWIQWRDYRGTVIALAKPDADPTTADGARGAASIQVTFRDWLWPWAWNYLDDIEGLTGDLTLRYTPLFQTDDPPGQLKEIVEADLLDRGVIGRIKYYMAAEKGLERVNPGTGPDPQRTKQQVINAVAAQRESEAHRATKVAEGPAVFVAHVGQQTATARVDQSTKAVSQRVSQTEVLQTQVATLEGRMQATERSAQNITSKLDAIDNNVRAINPLDQNSIKANMIKISADIASLKNR